MIRISFPFVIVKFKLLTKRVVSNLINIIFGDDPLSKSFRHEIEKYVTIRNSSTNKFNVPLVRWKGWKKLFVK